ncbi:MAG: DUF6240 domain-containing protein [Lachnospiraceae bacterium]|nr:DUF6240 domain-containing protein [Lachnospiraceae bacterium]
MKIDTNNINHNKNVDMEKTQYGNLRTKETAKSAAFMGGISVDISGTVTDNAAYGMGELKSSAEVMQDAGQKDIALQRKYMAVMSNSMSAEDSAKLWEEGHSLTDTDVETQVTSLDKLKAKLAQNGTVIAGYNDDLTDDQINEIAGGDIAAQQLRDVFARNDLPLNEENVRGIAEAADTAGKIGGLSDEVKKYMVINGLEPTIANLYKAEYSAGAGTGRQARGYYQDSTDGYYAKKADSFDMEQIRGQVEGIIKRSGLPVNETTLSEAEWIIKSGIPITEQTLGALDRLNSLTLPLSSESIIDISAIAINDGRTPVNAVIDKTEPDHVTASRIMDETAAITDAGVDMTIASDKEMTIRNMYDASQDINSSGAVNNEDTSTVAYDMADNPAQDKAVTARRQLEEVRLMMSAEVNLKLLKQGISIDTEPLSRLVTELKEAERSFFEPLLLDPSQRGDNKDIALLDGRISLYRETTDIFEQLRTVPAEVLGRLRGNDDPTVRSLNEQGNVLKAAYQRAGRSYETLMTAPRADMGDSIRKAFRNVDDILADNGFEINDANRKAVRILGYSQTEINPESINRVREADRAVKRVMELMTPAKTLELIRKGENPVDESIYSLSHRLEETSEDKNAERYSRFLRKLEERGDITDNEKAAFIGVYRLFRQIEKSDGKLIGNVLSSGEDLTLRNLLSASRSNRARGMDISVDNDFGGLTGLNRRGTSISEQIDRGFAGRGLENYLNSLATEALDKLSPEGMLKSGINIDKPLETFAHETIEGYEREEDLRQQLKDDREALNEARNSDDRVIELLRSNEQPVTVNNLLAAGELLNNRGKTFRTLMKEAGKTGRGNEEKLSRAVEEFTEKFTSKETAQEGYEELRHEAARVIDEAIDQTTGRVDVDTLKLLNKQISIASALSRQQNYEVPVNIEGEWTSINLKLVSGTGNEGNVVATMDSAVYGRVAARFTMSGKDCRGYITSDRQDGIDSLRDLKDELTELISVNGRNVSELDYVRSDGLRLNDFARTGEQREAADNADLYEVAKAFITVISRR